jgi:hypothetical protein
MAQRIKGQEVALAFATPNGPAEGLEDVVSFEWELMMEILQEGYLGETADRFDDIYRGASGTMEMHMEQQAAFAFQQQVQDRAERRSPAAGVFNATASFAFPNGQRPRITFENIFFDAQAMRTTDRGSYVAVTVPWKCTRPRRVL